MGLWRKFSNALDAGNKHKPSSEHVTPFSFVVATIFLAVLSVVAYFVFMFKLDMSQTKAALAALSFFGVMMWLGISRSLG